MTAMTEQDVRRRTGTHTRFNRRRFLTAAAGSALSVYVVPRHVLGGPKQTLGDNGIYFTGDKGTILCGGWAGTPRLIPESRMKDFRAPPQTTPRSIGHIPEWIRVCKQGKPEDSKAGFAYSGPYTEALLVGNLAVRLQERVEWNSAAMKTTNAPDADSLIHKTHRSGFGI